MYSFYNERKRKNKENAWVNLPFRAMSHTDPIPNTNPKYRVWGKKGLVTCTPEEQNHFWLRATDSGASQGTEANKG